MILKSCIVRVWGRTCIAGYSLPATGGRALRGDYCGTDVEPDLDNEATGTFFL